LVDTGFLRANVTFKVEKWIYLKTL
jgi:hypothetical protein